MFPYVTITSTQISFITANELVPLDFHHIFTVAKSKFFHSLTQTGCTIFRHPMAKAIRPKNHCANGITHVNANGNCQEEVIVRRLCQLLKNEIFHNFQLH